MDDVTLVKTIAQVLDSRSSLVWKETGGGYAADEVGIYYGSLPSAPDRAVGVSLYLSSDEIGTGLAVRRVQFRLRGARGDRTGADLLAGVVFEALQGLTRASGLSLLTRVSMAQLGTDENERQERADSYQITLDN